MILHNLPARPSITSCFFVATICSKFLYPKQSAPDDTSSDDGEMSRRGQHDGKYELFAEVDDTVHEEIKDLILNG